MAQPNPSSGHPSSYHTNVNRAKTQKWVDAKSYSYDGDDWGDVDDYDEYDNYEAPPKPTGLRKRGQSTSQPPEETHPALSASNQSFQEQGGQSQNDPKSHSPQQKYGLRSVTKPQTHLQTQTILPRSDSYDHEDERRVFSAGDSQHYMSTTPTALQAPQTPKNQPAYVNDHPNPPDLDQSDPFPQPLNILNNYNTKRQNRLSNDLPSSPSDAFQSQSMRKRTQSATAKDFASNVEDRRELSPPAAVPPLQTQGTSHDSRPSSGYPPRSPGHPPRKSSMSQKTTPTLPTQGPQSPSSIASQGDVPVPHRERSESSASAGRIIRPADIYRRMQEEREKEKQSQDSTKASTDASAYRKGERPVLDNRQHSESSQGVRAPTLDPVAERKTEHGLQMNEFQPKFDASPGVQDREKQRTTSKTFEIKKPTPGKAIKNEASGGPLLPDVTRMSGFGDSFLNDHFGQDSHAPFLQPSESQSRAKPQERSEGNRNSGLQHQPSKGFTSAVQQSFDDAQDQVPPTPTSTVGSTIGRSASGGTSMVSPIISREPSTAVHNWNTQLPGIDDLSEREDQQSRPITSDSLGTPTHKTPTSFLPSESHHELTEQSPRSFIPGHRRDMSTPSPDNSPARSPAIEGNRPLRQPQEVELAETTPTPTDTTLSTSNSFRDSERDVEAFNSTVPDDVTKTDRTGLNPTSRNQSTGLGGFESAVVPESPVSPMRNFAGRRTDSSGSGRVRNLADRFESHSRPDSAHSSTPRTSIIAQTIPSKDDLPRPVNERQETFRPQLPGGWESSASIAPSMVARKPSSLDTGRFQERSIPGMSGSSYSRAEEAPSSASQIKDVSSSAISAVAEAGTALAEAFSAAVGMENPDHYTSVPHEATGEDEQGSKVHPPARDRTASVNTVIHPEGSTPYMPLSRDDETSTAAPTPLPKDTPKLHGSSYFPVATTDRDASNANSDQTGQRSCLPPLSTASVPLQYESDRLRREIVKDLDSHMASEPTTAESDSPYQASSKYSANDISRFQTTESEARQARESSVLPQEYGDYWDDDKSEDGSVVDGLRVGQLPDAVDAQRRPGPAALGDPFEKTTPAHSAPSRGVDGAQMAQEKPHTVQHRFSWEQPLHDLNHPSAGSQEAQNAPTSDFPRSAVYPEGHLTSAHKLPTDPSENNEKSLGADSKMPVNDSVPGKPTMSPSTPAELAFAQPVPGLGNAERDPATYPDNMGGLEAGQSSAKKQSIESLSPDHTSSVSSSRNVNRVVEQGQPEESQHMSEPSTAIAAKNGGFPEPPAPASAQPKIPAFREILALKAPTDRIRAYNEARAQFAGLNIGLAYWLATMVSEQPEHADVLTAQGRSTPNYGSSLPRSKTTGQPYSLNANALSSGPISDNSSGAVGGLNSQGFSPAGGAVPKISGQQVQARSKELLHSAGVFGGKANVAAKGLFSKGKSKLRGASGAEKITSFTKNPNPHQEKQLHQSFRSTPTNNARPKSSPDRKETRSLGPSPVSTDAMNSSYQVHGVEPESDTPSVESVEMGDDEQSEDSIAETQARRNHAHSSRNASPYPKDSSGTMERISAASLPPTAFLGHTGPVFLRESSAAESYAITPKAPSPRSTASSSKTPTQSNFDREEVPIMPFPVHETESPQDAQESETRSFFPPVSRYSSRMSTSVASQTGDQPHDVTSDQGPLQTTSTIFNRSSNVTDNEKEHSGLPGSAQDPVMSGEPRLVSHLVSHHGPTALLKPFPLQSHVPNVSMQGTNSDSPIKSPISIRDEDDDGLRPPQDKSDHRPSANDISSPLNSERIPSPVSPMPTVMEQRGRTIVPVHHGIDHDFIENNDVERSRRRSRSFSRPFSTPPGSAEDDRPFPRPDSQIQPAYSQQSPSAEDIATPVYFYADQIPPGAGMMPRQQAPEYDLESTGAPDLPPSDAKPRSRRGSRSSAFFKSLGNSSYTDLPSVPHKPESVHHSPISNASPSNEMKARRSSVFRPFRGANDGTINKQDASRERSRSRSATSAAPQSHQLLHSNTALVFVARDEEDDEFPPRPKPLKETTSKSFSKRLQRASTSNNPELAPGKKKRFSAIGSLFSRASPKLQASPDETLPPPKQPPEPHSVPPAPKQSGEPLMQLAETNRAPATTGTQNSEHYTSSQGLVHPGYYAPNPIDSTESQDPKIHRVRQSLQQQGFIAQRPKADAPAYVQDAMSRQGSIPSPQAQGKKSSRASMDFFRSSPQRSSSTLPQVPKALRTSSQDLISKHRGSENSGSPWTRFSSHGRSKSRGPTQPSPHANDTHQSPKTIRQIDSSLQRESRPQRPSPPQPFRSEPSSNGTYPSSTQASNHASPSQNNTQVPKSIPPEPFRSDSPPPPAPPPKDEWHRARPRQSSLGPAHSMNQASTARLQSDASISAAQGPSLTRPTRQSLPALQTNVPSPNLRFSKWGSAYNSATSKNSSRGSNNLTPEEKRKSRQQEIETEHLMTAESSAAATKANLPRRGQEQQEEEPVVMSATSFPGQEWMPGGFNHYED